MSDICLVHLVWFKIGLAPFRQFVESYRRYDAGIPHRLLLVFKEFPVGEPRDAYNRLTEGLEHDRLEMPGTVLDIPAYFRIAAAREEGYLCFLNSTAEILQPGWLAHLYGHAVKPGIGVVGATGSWESLLTYAIRCVHDAAAVAGVPVTDELLRQYTPAYAHNFPPFPNAHIRTNGFLLSRELFLSMPFVPGNDKNECLKFESGRLGLSCQIQSRKLRLLVVGRDGIGYDVRDWPESRTFRIGSQENLLIGDNQTRNYETADPQTRRMFTSSTWGR